MKTVFKSHQEVCTAFVNQESKIGRAGNIFFGSAQLNNDICSIIYSYGDHFPMGRLTKGKCLVTTRKWSSSTSAHLSHLTRALYKASLEMIRCDKVTAISLEDHKANIQGLIDTAYEFAGKSRRARVYSDYYRGESKKYLQYAREYVALFRIKSKLPSKIKNALYKGVLA